MNYYKEEQVIEGFCIIENRKTSFYRENKRKRGNKMKKVSKNFEKILAKAALVSASNNVNSTCRWYVYQELVPQSAKKLKKIK